MKKTLSLLLAALLLASSMTACGNNAPKETEAETNAPDTTLVETKAPETAPSVETNAQETEAPVKEPDTLTENGIAKCHIVVSADAHDWVKLGAKELSYHLNVVSGAEVAVSDSLSTDSTPILIGTPATLPELETLFPEDMNWLRDLDGDDTYKRYGADGFAVRTHEGKVYIFGATDRGALNGVYDFIEENLGVIWVREADDIGLVHSEMPTVTLVKGNYREKSPFDVRGYTIWGNGVNDEMYTLMSRNKLSYNNVGYFRPTQSVLEPKTSTGLKITMFEHNVRNWVTSSPIYDPNSQEYWETHIDGTSLGVSGTNQVNFWSEMVADTAAASILQYLDEYAEALELDHIGISMMDNEFNSGVYPEQTLPFEYAPGQFVNPGDADYLSTVYFTFINRIARQVKEKYPNIFINTWSYQIAKTTPRCKLEDNVLVQVCLIDEDVSQPINEPCGADHKETFDNLALWIEKTSNLIPLNYHHCSKMTFAYERPIWDRMKDDFLFYAEHGLIGAMNTQIGDVAIGFWWDENGERGFHSVYTQSDAWAMNTLSSWLYAKLAWDPMADIDALIKEFCDKCYGEASEEMQEYYRLLEFGWNEGCEGIRTEEYYNSNVLWDYTSEFYFPIFVDLDDPTTGEYLPDAMTAALDAAYEAAQKDTEKTRIGEIRRLFNAFIEENQ